MAHFFITTASCFIDGGRLTVPAFDVRLMVSGSHETGSQPNSGNTGKQGTQGGVGSTQEGLMKQLIRNLFFVR